MNLKNKKLYVLLLLLLMLGSIFWAANAGESKEGGQEGRFKEVTVALYNRPDTFNPNDTRDSRSSNIMRNVCGGILCQTNDGGPVYDLCESITEVDEVTYEMKVRKGITFHNGEPLTADDFVFSITRTAIIGGMDGDTSPLRNNCGPVESVEKIDDYTVRVKMESPQNFFTQFRKWTNITILPKRYFEEVGIEGWNKHPIGCGPFKWVEGNLENHVVLERFDDYWGGPAEFEGEVDRIPALDRATFVYILEPTTRIAALLAGDVDIIQHVSFDSIPVLEGNPNTKIVGSPATRVRSMHFNVNKPPLNDKRVRQAIAYAVDYELIASQLCAGFTEIMYGRPYLTPYTGFPGFPADVVEHLLYEYNPEKARALLKEAGVSEANLVIDTDSDLVTEAEAIAQMLQDVGLHTSVRIWEIAVLQEEFRKGERDIMLETRGQGARSPEGYRNVAFTDNPTNFSGYSNPEYDTLISAALAIPDDTAERQDLFIKSYDIAMDDLPCLWIHTPHMIEACRANVKNFTPHSTQARVNLHRVDIE